MNDKEMMRVTLLILPEREYGLESEEDLVAVDGAVISAVITVSVIG